VGQWYVTDEAPQDLVDVLALGVRPTCLDSAALHGLWVPPGGGAHAFRPRAVDAPTPAPRVRPIRRRRDPGTDELEPLVETGQGRRMLGPARLVMHSPRLRSWGTDDPVPDILRTLHHAARCLPTVKAAILIESALDLGRLTASGLEALLAGLPQRYRRPLRRVRSDAQSGTETAVRWWFEERCVQVRSQVQLLPGVRVDLLLGTNWVIECDSRTFHDNPLQYAEDRRRDLLLSTYGYRVTRLTWEQVFLYWESTSRMLQTILRRRDHSRALPS
jgi:very-short-patch-repair endonuclease